MPKTVDPDDRLASDQCSKQVLLCRDMAPPVVTDHDEGRSPWDDPDSFTLVFIDHIRMLTLAEISKAAGRLPDTSLFAKHNAETNCA